MFHPRTMGAPSPDLLPKGWMLYDGEAWKEDPEVQASVLEGASSRCPQQPCQRPFAALFPILFSSFSHLFCYDVSPVDVDTRASAGGASNGRPERGVLGTLAGRRSPSFEDHSIHKI